MDKSICHTPVTQQLPQYALAIQDALSNGYVVDTVQGIIYGRTGKRLTIALRGAQRYPFVSLLTPNMPKKFYVVPAHKVVAFARWGFEAFAPGVQVRHLQGNVLDLSEQSLLLGSGSQNNLDKSPVVRQSAARIARASQGKLPHNASTGYESVDQIKKDYWQFRGAKGKLPNGTTEFFLQKYGISRFVLNKIVRGETYHE